jgi:RimJ/RimL family protein N-acetyltransferase
MDGDKTLIADTAQRPEYLEFASRLTGTKAFGECSTIAIHDDSLLAVLVYNAKDEANIGISIASTSPRWCSKLSLKVIFGFPFVQLGLNRVTATIRETNRKSISVVERLGFILEGELTQYYTSGESAMIYGLTKDNCRWIK